MPRVLVLTPGLCTPLHPTRHGRRLSEKLKEVGAHTDHGMRAPAPSSSSRRRRGGGGGGRRLRGPRGRLYMRRRRRRRRRGWGQWAYIAKRGGARPRRMDRIWLDVLGGRGEIAVVRLARSRCPRDCGARGVDTKSAKEKRK